MAFGRQVLLEKLEKLVDEGSDDQELNLLIDSLRVKLVMKNQRQYIFLEK